VKRIPGFVIVSVLLGCTASLQEIREQPPRYTGDFPKPYQALARCVFERMDEQTGRHTWGGLPAFIYRLDDQPDERRARVNARAGTGAADVWFEITVEATAAGVSPVEYKHKWGTRSAGSLERDAWAIVTACGQS
jgi:hypothetical protein